MVEEVVLHDGAARRAEQRPACAVVAYDVVGKEHLGRPLQILDAEVVTAAYGLVQRFLEGYAETLHTLVHGGVDSLDRGDDVGPSMISIRRER